MKKPPDSWPLNSQVARGPWGEFAHAIDKKPQRGGGALANGPPLRSAGALERR
jgi:hypothetical protein